MAIQHAILVATGHDRPGVMDEIAEFVQGHGGAIADSRSINLRGQFALLVLLSGSGASMDAIRNGMIELSERVGMHARIDTAAASDGGDTFPYRFTATGKNHPRVIHGISHLMRVLGINIESLQTQESGANGPEQRNFKMELGLAVPREVPIVNLRQYLDQLCGEMNVKYELSTL